MNMKHRKVVVRRKYPLMKIPVPILMNVRRANVTSANTTVTILEMYMMIAMNFESRSPVYFTFLV